MRYFSFLDTVHGNYHTASNFYSKINHNDEWLILGLCHQPTLKLAHTSLYKHIHLENAQKDNVEITRRLSYGGTAYLDEGILFCSMRGGKLKPFLAEVIREFGVQARVHSNEIYVKHESGLSRFAAFTQADFVKATEIEECLINVSTPAHKTMPYYTDQALIEIYDHIQCGNGNIVPLSTMIQGLTVKQLVEKIANLWNADKEITFEEIQKDEADDRVRGGTAAQRQAWAWHMGLQRYTVQLHGANLPVILRTMAVFVHCRHTA